MKISHLNDEFFNRLETMSLEFNANLAGFFGGKHKTRTYGQTVEFSDYREYMLGDDIRRIDWNLFSRFEKHYLKLFTDERQMHTQVFIDCSASMGKTNPAKGAYALAIAAALGFLSVHNMDKVSFKLMKENICDDPSGLIVGKTTFFKAIGDLERIDFSGGTDIASAIMSCPDIGSNDGLTVIISDFFTDSDWKKAVNFLCHKKKQVLLMQIMSPEEIDPTYTGRMHLLDAESSDLSDTKNMRIRVTRGMQQAYQEAMNELVGELKTFTRSRGADFITVRTDSVIEKVLFGELLRAGIMV